MRTLLCLLLLTSFSTLASSQCSAPEYRQFDFWLGHWNVSIENDNVIRTNRISLINNGCTLLEEYTTPDGYQGKSLNMYDRASGMWHQTWMDNSGLVLKLSGKFIDGKMVMAGKTQTAQGIQLNKITWQTLADGRVNQHWQTSRDNGKTWQTAFNGYYQKAKSQ